MTEDQISETCSQVRAPREKGMVPWVCEISAYKAGGMVLFIELRNTESLDRNWLFFVWVMRQRSRREIIISVGMVYIFRSFQCISEEVPKWTFNYIWQWRSQRSPTLDSFLTQCGYLFSLLVSRKSPLPSISFLEFVFHTVAGTTLWKTQTWYSCSLV